LRFVMRFGSLEHEQKDRRSSVGSTTSAGRSRRRQPQLGASEKPGWGSAVRYKGIGRATVSARSRDESGTQRLLLIALAVALAGAACSGGSSRHAVSTPFGYTLDCLSESIVSAAGQVMPGATGSDTAQQAVEVFQGEARPPGDPSIEAATGGKVVFVFRDADGNRLGHLFVAQTAKGWFVLQMERCEEEP
jgi:hypothetical protein